jgi:hypothetical protein
VIQLKKRVLGYFLSAASVYLAMGYITQLFLRIMSKFTFAVI